MTDILFDASTTPGVARITLNRPDVLNSFTRGMSAEFCQAIARVAADASLRAVLVTGAGRAFCAGQDLVEVAPVNGVQPDLGDVVRATYNPIVRAIRRLEKPVVCAVNGTAAGAGANIALACDVVFAASNATFIQSFARVGLIPDSGGTFLLPRIVGLQRASAMTMLCDKIDANTAQSWGMVYQICAPEALAETALAAANRLASMPTYAIGLTKLAFNRSLGVDLDDQLDAEERLQREAGQSADYAEGVTAFLEKRQPRFVGR
jgi:2-(1,2-epoxy-1,2-dihydrophenyl)acetyl-CoA isomerase